MKQNPIKVSPYISKIPFLGGNLSLDFVNTVYDRHEERLRDLLQNYLDLVTWVHFAGAIDSSQKEKLLQKGRENQRKANQLYKDSLQLREALYDFDFQVINGGKVAPTSVPLINQWLSKAFSNLELTQLDHRFVLDWKPDNFALESVLWPILRAFADLVTNDDLERIKQCSNCGYVFLDNSKNKSRRWCSMEICGNRVKARRHARKARSS